MMKARAAPLASAVARARSRARSAIGRVAIRAFDREDLAVRALERRAAEAAIWGLPAVAFDAALQAAARAGAGDNQIVYWSRPGEWKNQTLTPDSEALCTFAFFNTKDAGPMVLEIPPPEDALILGSVMDCWQGSLEEVGPAGAARGQGRYLILPPSWSDVVPEGYVPLRPGTYRGYAALCSIASGSGEAAIAGAVAHGRRVLLYPLSSAGAPATVRLDVTGTLFDATIPYDERFFTSLNRVVQTEPWRERDRVMIDLLRSIGIEKGRAFAPDRRTAETLALGAGEADAWLAQRFESALRPFFPEEDGVAESRWLSLSDELDREYSYPVDARATVCHRAFGDDGRNGERLSLFATRDGRGAFLDGGKTYRLVVPVDVPVRRHWSATAYDLATHALIREVSWGSRSSLTPGLATTADGSIEVYFGPKPPGGKEASWIPTKPGARFEVVFRLHGPEKALFDRRWRLPDLELRGSNGAWIGTVRAALSPPEAKAIAREAYLFGLPLVDQGRRALEPHTPSNRLIHARSLGVGDVDMLGSTAALDLTAEPLVLSIPPTGDRWWLMQVDDLWNEVAAAPGTRTVGNGGGALALCGPHYKGALPPELRDLRVGTSLCRLGGRIHTAGPGDLAAVRALQDRCRLTPLSRWRSGGDEAGPVSEPPAPARDAGTPTMAAGTPAMTQVFTLPTELFFGRLAALMVDNPAREADEPTLARMAKLGVARGGRFSFAGLAPEMQSAIEAGVAEAKAAIVDAESRLVREVGGWTVALDAGRRGTNYYLQRAARTYFGVGAGLAEDLVCPYTTKDADGRPLDGIHRYILRFAPGALPPAHDHWSLTVHDLDGRLFPGAIAGAGVDSTSAAGALTVQIQAEPPAAHEAGPGARHEARRWLAAPAEGPFKLELRVYGPRQSVLTGGWWPPPVQRIV
jgi:hypothetical protein